MYVVNGIAYAGERRQPIHVCGVRPMEDYKLWLRFSTGEVKVVDFKPLLEDDVFAPLLDKSVFSAVYIDHGVTVWDDGNIDVAPEWLYENSVSVCGVSNA